jgi:hypothetical protein
VACSVTVVFLEDYKIGVNQVCLGYEVCFVEDPFFVEGCLTEIYSETVYVFSEVG